MFEHIIETLFFAVLLPILLVITLVGMGFLIYQFFTREE